MTTADKLKSKGEKFNDGRIADGKVTDLYVQSCQYFVSPFSGVYGSLEQHAEWMDNAEREVPFR